MKILSTFLSILFTITLLVPSYQVQAEAKPLNTEENQFCQGLSDNINMKIDRNTLDHKKLIKLINNFLNECEEYLKQEEGYGIASLLYGIFYFKNKEDNALLASRYRMKSKLYSARACIQAGGKQCISQLSQCYNQKEYKDQLQCIDTIIIDAEYPNDIEVEKIDIYESTRYGITNDQGKTDVYLELSKMIDQTQVAHIYFINQEGKLQYPDLSQVVYQENIETPYDGKRNILILLTQDLANGEYDVRINSGIHSTKHKAAIKQDIVHSFTVDWNNK